MKTAITHPGCYTTSYTLEYDHYGSVCLCASTLHLSHPISSLERLLTQDPGPVRQLRRVRPNGTPRCRHPTLHAVRAYAVTAVASVGPIFPSGLNLLQREYVSGKTWGGEVIQPVIMALYTHQQLQSNSGGGET